MGAWSHWLVFIYHYYITHMALQITTFSNKDQKIKAVIFGDSGTGKTSFAGTAARKYKTLFISAEGWLASIRKWQKNPWSWEVNDNNLNVLQLTQVDQIRELRQKGVLNKLTADYDVIVIDSLTEISDSIKRSFKEGKKSVTLQDWGVIADQIKDFVIQCRDLNKHVLVICHEHVEKDGDTVVKYMPFVDGSFKQKIPYFFDVVGRVIKSPGGQRRIEINESEKAPVKSRFECINDNTDFDFSTWIDLVLDDADTVETEVIETFDTNQDYQDALTASGFSNLDSAKKIYTYLSSVLYDADEVTKMKTDLQASPKFSDAEKKAAVLFIDKLIEWQQK